MERASSELEHIGCSEYQGCIVQVRLTFRVVAVNSVQLIFVEIEKVVFVVTEANLRQIIPNNLFQTYQEAVDCCDSVFGISISRSFLALNPVGDSFRMILADEFLVKKLLAFVWR